MHLPMTPGLWWPPGSSLPAMPLPRITPLPACSAQWCPMEPRCISARRPGASRACGGCACIGMPPCRLARVRRRTLHRSRADLPRSGRRARPRRPGRARGRPRPGGAGEPDPPRRGHRSGRPTVGGRGDASRGIRPGWCRVRAPRADCACCSCSPGYRSRRSLVEVQDRAGRLRRLDLAWRAVKVAVEYDGRHHVDREDQWQRDVIRREDLEAQGGVSWS